MESAWSEPRKVNFLRPWTLNLKIYEWVSQNPKLRWLKWRREAQKLIWFSFYAKNVEKLHKKCIRIDEMLLLSVCGVAYYEFVPEFANSIWRSKMADRVFKNALLHSILFHMLLRVFGPKVVSVWLRWHLANL